MRLSWDDARQAPVRQGAGFFRPSACTQGVTCGIGAAFASVALLAYLSLFSS